MVSEKLDRANEPPKWMEVYVTQNATVHVGLVHNLTVLCTLNALNSYRLLYSGSNHGAL